MLPVVAAVVIVVVAANVSIAVVVAAVNAGIVVVVVVADKDATTGLISLCGIPLIPYKPDVRLGTSGTPELVDTA
jgi:hypothetical protein